MAAIAYYLFIKPLSLLPLRLLYVFSDFYFLLSVGLFPYRKKVIDNNLKNSFPHLSSKELNAIRRKFYRHFIDLLVESIKNLSISQSELQNRFRIKNPELMKDLYDKGKSVVLVSGHYNNWEWLITSQPLVFQHKAMGIGMPLSSKFLDKKINDRRQRYGMQVINAKNFKDEIKKQHIPFAILTLGDQSPPNSKKSYWMKFLNQQTAILFGTEQMAHEFNLSVVFFLVRKQKRGFYEMELKLLTEDPKALKWGGITEMHTKMLEKAINEEPEYWLWSHKRWKRELPEDLVSLRMEQQVKFNERFNSVVN
jgi:KDO2-lipid IV(A) lauroyltransferase